VIAGLQARIDSLRQGGKGLMLDVAHGMDMAELLSHSTVLELDRIGNDDEKAFIIGLLMTRIVSFRRLQGNGPLQHVTVVEEAHRLLKNLNTEVGTEEASNKAAAVEVFTNALSEIRAYGEGVIVAEQIPAKLAPDAIKNTNLKLMHRLLASDDREAIGATINLSEAQSRRAVALDPKRGEVIAFAEGQDKPLLLQMTPVGQVSATPPKDVAIQQLMTAHTQPALYEPVPEFNALVGEPDPAANLSIRSEARIIARDPALNDALIRYFYAVMTDPSAALNKVAGVLQPIRQARAGRVAPYEVNLHVATAVWAATLLVRSLGDQYGIPYSALDALRHDFVALLDQAIRAFTQGQPALHARLQPIAAALAGEWKALTQAQFGPLIGCAPCPAKCLYRAVGDALARDRAAVAAIQEAMQTATSSTMWLEVAARCDHYAGDITQQADARRAIRICLAAHYAHMHHRDNDSLQRRFVRNVAQA
jgi:hypothetical protein